MDEVGVNMVTLFKKKNGRGGVAEDKFNNALYNKCWNVSHACIIIYLCLLNMYQHNLIINVSD